VHTHRSLAAATLVALLSLPTTAQAAKARLDAWLEPPPLQAPAEDLGAALDAFEGHLDELTPRVSGTDEARSNGIAVLLEEQGFRYDAEGRETTVYRRIYRVLTEGGAEITDTIGAHWSPWHQERPVLRARVIHADGEVHLLDPDAAVVQGAPEPGQKVYSDARELVAPLPSIEVGAIVEFVVEISEHRPFCPAGRSHIAMLEFDEPAAVALTWIEQPAKAPFEWVLHGDAEIERLDERMDDGARRRSFVARDRPGWEWVEGYLPPDARSVPMLEYSTATSWADVAQSYLGPVEEALSAEDTSTAIQPLLDEALAGDDPASLERADLVSRLLASLRSRVRYTGLNLGDAAIVPRSPAVTLERAYGDCKDQATLLVALLDAVGIEAHVALVTTGPGTDQMHEMPGLDGFDHAIVVIPGDEPMWIDPAAELVPPGELPSMDQDRLALVIDAGTRGLMATPMSTAQSNRLLRTKRMEMPFLGAVSVTDSQTGLGATGTGLRYFGQSLEQTVIEDLRTSAAAREEGESGIETVEYGDPEDLTVPFVFTTTGLDEDAGWVDEGTAWALLSEETLFDYLPVYWSSVNATRG